ncbi:MAG: hypothetical protein LIO78_11250, partial [Clostridiales bacterium]|nr:hypothetical protein [Clostridiales bacterium]
LGFVLLLPGATSFDNTDFCEKIFHGFLAKMVGMCYDNCAEGETAVRVLQSHYQKHRRTSSFLKTPE